MAENTLGVCLLDLMICRIPGLKEKERIELVKKFDKEEVFSLLSKKDLESLLGRGLNDPWTMPQIRGMAEKDAVSAKKLGIRWVSWRESSYPPLLREIYDPPALLFFRGALPDPEKPLAAVVGTRKPSAKAAERAYGLGRELGEAGIPVVSGLALGIDSMAHRGNIEAGSPTVAVLGSGPDHVYPVSNRDLARRILEIGGLILSEYPPGTKPLKWNFPARNRIISGLARGTVVVEAPEKSGALITADFALAQGRDLWVERTGVTSKRGAGTARLAEDGAVIISSADAILADWKMPCAAKDRERQRDIAQSPGVGIASSMAEYLDIKL
jgi:DNA processing protein